MNLDGLITEAELWIAEEEDRARHMLMHGSTPTAPPANDIHPLAIDLPADAARTWRTNGDAVALRLRALGSMRQLLAALAAQAIPASRAREEINRAKRELPDIPGSL